MQFTKIIKEQELEAELKLANSNKPLKWSGTVRDLFR